MRISSLRVPFFLTGCGSAFLLQFYYSIKRPIWEETRDNIVDEKLIKKHIYKRGFFVYNSILELQMKVECINVRI